MPFDPINPLSAIGASNDPSLTARTTANNAGAIELQNALGKLAAGGQNDRRLAGINNTSLERRTGMPLGLDPGNANYQAGLAQIGADISAVRGSEAYKNEATAATGLADSLGLYATPKNTLAETVSRTNSAAIGTPGNILKNAATGSDAAKVTAKRTTGDEQDFTMVNGVPIGTYRKKVTSEDQNTVEGKNTEQAKDITQIVLSKILSKLGPNTEVGDVITGPDGKIRAKINGVWTVINL